MSFQERVAGIKNEVLKNYSTEIHELGTRIEASKNNIKQREPEELTH